MIKHISKDQKCDFVLYSQWHRLHNLVASQQTKSSDTMYTIFTELLHFNGLTDFNSKFLL